jgi:chloride channel protein, CIC family
MKHYPWIKTLKQPFQRLFRTEARYNHLILGLIATITGAIVAYGSIAFHWIIDQTSLLTMGSLSPLNPDIPRWQLFWAPVMGGVVVAFLIRYLRNGRRAGSVTEVIEANAIANGHMGLKDGISSALVTAISLGSGASAGREGPVVHMGAAIAALVRRTFHLPHEVGRTMLACGVAAAIGASFNAPIAGVFFALEVVIGHYAIHTFAPVVISSVVATIISRIYMGDFPAFIIPDLSIVSTLEFPAFALLGMVCALVAIVFMISIDKAQNLSLKIPLPQWVLPPFGGLLLGAMAMWVPEVIGVGYQATDNALQGSYGLSMLLLLLFAKIIATSITTGSFFGGGIFSPSLYIGAMAGGAFGIAFASLFPEYSSASNVYAIVGMGAVAASVLGAPISTILIVFEMTGNYSVTMAVMIAAALSSLITGIYHKTSFFHWQLEKRGVHLEDGQAKYLLKSTHVYNYIDRDFITVSKDMPANKVREMFFDQDGGSILVTDETGGLYGIITARELSYEVGGEGTEQPLLAADICSRNSVSVAPGDSLEVALDLMVGEGVNHLPVIDDLKTRVVIGFMHYRQVMFIYNQALTDSQDELYSTRHKKRG